MEIGEASVQTNSTETFKKPAQHKDLSKSRHQPRSREPSISTDNESIIGDHLENIPSTIYAEELGVTIHIELQDVPQTETIQPEALRTLYHTNKIKFTINFHSAHTESSIRTLIHHNQLKEITNKLNIVDRDTFRKIRPGKEKSPLQSGKSKAKTTR